MNVFAINSSLRGGGQSKTELMLQHLVEGMRQSGAEVEVVNLRQKEVKYCIGCYTCMTKTPGHCVHQDDMTQELFPKFLAADLVVYAMPLFHHTVNAPLKTFIERTFPMVEPFIEQRENGRWSHPLRQRHPGIVLLSVCGFPEVSEFDALSHYMRHLYGKGLLAEIYRPGAEALIHQREVLDNVLAATEQAGRELIEAGRVSPETLARIQRPITDNTDSFVDMANLAWQTCIDEGITLSAFARRKITPRPNSVESFMLIMPMGFNSQAAGDTRAVLQFVFSGEVEGACYFTIQEGTIEATLGQADQPDLTIRAPFDVWMDVVTGKADGAQMMMEQKYSAVGDISLLLRMNQLFSSAE